MKYCPLLVVCLSFLLSSFSAADNKNPPAQNAPKETAAPSDDAGPYLTDTSKTPQVAKGEKGEKPVVDFEKLKNADLAKEPWLVESAALPPNHPAFQRPQMIWADSWFLNDAPEIEIEKWVTGPPKDLAGKFVLVEVWATWCPPCRKSLPLLNFYHEKYGDDLVVIAICETDEDAIKAMQGPLALKDVKFHLAVDTGRRFANKLGVYGIPHAVILEPQFGAVVWEGMPTQPGHELSDKKIEKILAVRKQLAEAGQLPKESPVKIHVAPPSAKPEQKTSRAIAW
ncbi:MAG: TlpA family protein disulfide reductase [Planctomycetaceae bacterium]|nr:TlpA family protein disulfide reductase [Planctomycetaceae bacterium]